MSEYASGINNLPPEKPIRVHRIEEGNALFDDNFAYVEHLVDQGISYDDARRELGIEKPSYQTPEVIEDPNVDLHPGAAVELGARALAISNIMDTYNQLNKTRGARMVRDYTNNPFDKRYKRAADEMQEIMGIKASVMIHRNKEDFNTLAATSEMIEAGFTEEEAAAYRNGIEKKILNEYGPGKALADDRKKLVKRVSHTAQTVNRSNKKAA